MKPELKAMLDGFQRGYQFKHDGRPTLLTDPVNGLRESWLSALHWRGDDLWCGPIDVGGVWSDDGSLLEDGHYVNKIEYLCSWGGKT